MAVAAGMTGVAGIVVGLSAVVGAKPLGLLVTTSSVPAGAVASVWGGWVAPMSILPPPASSDAVFWILLRSVFHFSHMGLGATRSMTPNSVAVSWLPLCVKAIESRCGEPEMICGRSGCVRS